MAGLVPAIHVLSCCARKTWMPATSAGMTSGEGLAQFRHAPSDRRGARRSRAHAAAATPPCWWRRRRRQNHAGAAGAAPHVAERQQNHHAGAAADRGRASADRMAETLGERAGETVRLSCRASARKSRATTRIEVVTEGAPATKFLPINLELVPVSPWCCSTNRPTFARCRYRPGAGVGCVQRSARGSCESGHVERCSTARASQIAGRRAGHRQRKAGAFLRKNHVAARPMCRWSADGGCAPRALDAPILVGAGFPPAPPS